MFWRAPGAGASPHLGDLRSGASPGAQRALFCGAEVIGPARPPDRSDHSSLAGRQTPRLPPSPASRPAAADFARGETGSHRPGSGAVVSASWATRSPWVLHAIEDVVGGEESARASAGAEHGYPVSRHCRAYRGAANRRGGVQRAAAGVTARKISHVV